MARVIKRTWTSRGPTGHKVKRVSYGFTVQVDGKQERRFSRGVGQRPPEDARKSSCCGPDRRGGRSRITFVGRRRATGGEGPQEALGRRPQALRAPSANAFGQAHPVAIAITAAGGSARGSVPEGAPPARRRPSPPAPSTGPGPAPAPAAARLRGVGRAFPPCRGSAWRRNRKGGCGGSRWKRGRGSRRLRGGHNASLAGIVTVASRAGAPRRIMGLTWDRRRPVPRRDAPRRSERKTRAAAPRGADAPGHLRACWRPRPEPLRGGCGRSAGSGRPSRTPSRRLASETSASTTPATTSHRGSSCAGAASRLSRRILGHQDLKMTLRYAHLAREHLRQEAA